MERGEDPAVPGLQRERTALAWERTGVAFVVVSLLFLRAARGLAWFWQVPSIVVMAFGAFLILAGYRRYAREGPDPEPGWFAATRLVRAVGLATVAFSLTAAAMILLGRS